MLKTPHPLDDVGVLQDTQADRYVRIDFLDVVDKGDAFQQAQEPRFQTDGQRRGRGEDQIELLQLEQARQRADAMKTHIVEQARAHPAALDRDGGVIDRDVVVLALVQQPAPHAPERLALSGFRFDIVVGCRRQNRYVVSQLL